MGIISDSQKQRMTTEIRVGQVPSQRMQLLAQDGRQEQDLEKVGGGASETRAVRDPRLVLSTCDNMRYGTVLFCKAKNHKWYCT